MSCWLKLDIRLVVSRTSKIANLAGRLSIWKKVSEPSGGGSGQERAREAVGQEVGKIRQHNFDVYRALVFDAVSPIVGGTESFREDHRGAEDDGEAHAHQTSAYVV